MGLSKNIAYRLRTLRETAGLSQQEVADKADLSLSLITKMEQARKADPRASTIIALAAALGVRPGRLIEDLTPPPEGMFPGKGKKARKRKKKELEMAALSAVAASAEPSTNGSHDAEPVGVGAEVGEQQAAGAPGDDGKKKKKKAK